MVWKIKFGDSAKDALKTEPQQSEVLRYLNRTVAASENPRGYGNKQGKMWTYNTRGITINAKLNDDTTTIEVVEINFSNDE